MTQASIHPSSLMQQQTTPEIPSSLWRMLSVRGIKKRKLPQGVDAVWDRAMSAFVPLVPRQRIYLRRAARVLAMEPQFLNMSDAVLRHECDDMHAIFRRGRHKKTHVERAFALVREITWRQKGMKHYLVQVAAGLAMEAGCIAEMATGEGKTLSAVMPAVIAGWQGRGCHVITVNDYLAHRDAEELRCIYQACGLTCASVTGEMQPFERREGYNAGVTYTTNKDVAADFLRDRLSLGKLHGLPAALLSKIAYGMGQGTDRLVMRGLETAIIDEVDSVLIDEAATPLIISGDSPNAQQTDAFIQAAAIAKAMIPGTDYRVDQRYREVHLSKLGSNKANEMSLDFGGLWAGTRRREELVIQAITARELFIKDGHYVVHRSKEDEEEKIVIVDESTGRLMPDRTWRDGLHQAVEAKEGLKVNPPKATYARISFQRFFRMYRKLAGMTGTAAEGAGEFYQIYRRPTVLIPTNKPRIRKHAKDRVFATKEAKWNAIVAEIAKQHEAGRPILIGTRSVDASELLSKRLTELKLEHQVLNAVRHAEEAQIVAQAGQRSKITVATNMAGRGTDIKLGKGVADIGGLSVIAADRNDSLRVDRQLFGRAGRQGDPGSAAVFCSLEDELLKRYAPRWVHALIRKMRGKTGEVSSAMTRRLFTVSQKRALRMALRQRKGVLKSDDWLDEFLGFAGRED